MSQPNLRALKGGSGGANIEIYRDSYLNIDGDNIGIVTKVYMGIL